MSQVAARVRSAYRVAIPVEASRPSLIPADVWKSWQEEVEQAQRDESQRHLVAAAASPIALPDDDDLELVSAECAVGLAATTSADPEVASFALSQVPLFAELPKPSLAALAERARQGEIGSGEYLFLEGDPADSFFVVVDGTVEILRRREDREFALRHMGRGEAIGLFGLFSGQVRAACARAIGDAVVIEVPSSALARVVEQDRALHARLLRFYQERLLEGFLGSSTLFSDVDSIVRARLIGKFSERTLDAGDALVQPGEVANLFAVLITGRLHLELKPKAGAEPRLFELAPGQFVAVTSALSGSPCRMRVFAAEPSLVTMLGQRPFAELLRDHPALRSIAARLPSVARMLDRDVYCGHTGVPGL